MKPYVKPSFSFSEVCTLISLADCPKDIAYIDFVVIEEKKRYALNELYTLRELIKIRWEKIKPVM